MAATTSSEDSDKKILFFGRFISTPTPHALSIQRGALLVSSSRNGTIEKVKWDAISTVEDALDAFNIRKEAVEIVQCEEEGFFFPGFVDAHIHAPQYPNAGLFGKSTLLDWLKMYTFPMESSMGNPASPMYDSTLRTQTTKTPDPLSRAREVYTRVIRRTLAHGTTTASYYATIHVPATKLLFDLAFSHGQRAFIGRVCMDNPSTCPDYYRDDSLAAVLESEHECIAHARHLDATSTLVAPIITPRFAPSCTLPTLRALSDLAKSEDLRIQTHISENLSEVSLVRTIFPSHSSYASVYDATGILTPRTVLAHAVHLSPSERSLIRSRGSKIAHCPASNSALGSGICPVRTFLDEGLTVGLGTDVSGGYSPSILEAVRQACLVSRLIGFSVPHNTMTAPPPPQDEDPSQSLRQTLSSEPVTNSHFNISVTEALYLGTVGGAHVLGLEGEIGGIEVGMNFDVQEIALNGTVVGGTGEGKEEGERRSTNVDIFGWETWEEKVEKWVWGGDDRNVRRVWVGGRCVHSTL